MLSVAVKQSYKNSLQNYVQEKGWKVLPEYKSLLQLNRILHLWLFVDFEQFFTYYVFLKSAYLLVLAAD